MSNELNKRLAQLKAAYDGGLLDADTYRATVTRRCGFQPHK